MDIVDDQPLERPLSVWSLFSQEDPAIKYSLSDGVSIEMEAVKVSARPKSAFPQTLTRQLAFPEYAARAEEEEEAEQSFAKPKKFLRQCIDEDACLYRTIAWFECSFAKVLFVIGFVAAMAVMSLLYDMEKKIDDKLKSKFGYTSDAASPLPSCLLSIYTIFMHYMYSLWL